MKRRTFLGLSSAAGLLSCQPLTGRTLAGGFTHESHSLGHLLRDQIAWSQPNQHFTCHTLIAGGGIAGLSAAHHLLKAGVHDIKLLDLGVQVGGNAQGAHIQGIAHPLGAHYLPTPNPQSRHSAPILSLLESLGIARHTGVQWHYDERMLCHSPQERLYFNDAWQEGLLPTANINASTLAQYRAFQSHINTWQGTGTFGLATEHHTVPNTVKHLHTITFAQHLQNNGFNDPQLLWYLDYCCRDDYGAGSAVVSAWAGIHYFAARHGFAAPGDATERGAVLTWPHGNAYLSNALAKPLQERLCMQRLIVRIKQNKHTVEVDAWNPNIQQLERYTAKHCIVALPAYIAARVLDTAPTALQEQAAHITYSAWTVSNVHITAKLQDGWGSATELAWDNVLYGSASLGYVNATHQTLQQYPQSTVLTHYIAHGASTGARQRLMSQSWQSISHAVMTELARVHPDIYQLASTVNITRYGHAMACPTPGHAPAPTPQLPRISFAHSDWAGYSIFEEAYLQGVTAAKRVLTLKV